MIVWTRLAIADLESLREAAFEVGRSSKAALRVLAAVSLLERSPHLGRPGRVKGTREFVLVDVPFIVAYRASGAGERLEVLRVLHTSRRWPSRLP